MSDNSSGVPERMEDPEPPPGLAGHESPSFLERLFGRSNGELDDHLENGRAELGPAFRESSPAELAMVANILRMRDLRVEDVMIPRADIEAVAEDTPLSDVIGTFARASLSRLPVYRQTLDDPIGFVHLKDVALNYGFGATTEEFRLSELIRTALFVPPSMPIAALLQKMQGERVHMALVIDEFGGVDGLITIEDLVEQIVGDIEDEHDIDVAEPWVREADGVYLVSARADIREFEEAEGVHLLPEGWEEEVDTLGGLVFKLANHVPARGEVIQHADGHEFEVVDADARKIKRLRVSINQPLTAAPMASDQAAE